MGNITLTTVCPHCGESLEFALEKSALTAAIKRVKGKALVTPVYTGCVRCGCQVTFLFSKKALKTALKLENDVVDSLVVSGLVVLAKPQDGA